MAAISDFPARGKVLSLADGNVVFAPVDTNYRLHLASADHFFAALAGQMVKADIHASARKIYTMAAGGGFIAPIFGIPKVVQGRVVYADQSTLVVRAGTLIAIKLPPTADAIDLVNGPIAVGSMVNAVLQPGASIHPAAAHG